LAAVRVAEVTAIGLGAALFDAESPANLDFEVHSPESILQARRTLQLQDADIEAIGAQAARTLPGVDPDLERLLKVRLAQRKQQATGKAAK